MILPQATEVLVKLKNDGEQILMGEVVRKLMKYNQSISMHRSSETAKVEIIGNNSLLYDIVALLTDAGHEEYAETFKSAYGLE